MGAPMRSTFCALGNAPHGAPQDNHVLRGGRFSHRNGFLFGVFFLFFEVSSGFYFIFLFFFTFFFVILFPIFCLFFLSPVFLFLSGFLFVHNYASVWSTGERTCFAPSWEHNLVHLGAHVCFRWSIICASPPTEEHFSSLGNTG